MWLSRFKYYCTIHLTIKETEEPKSNSLLWNTIPTMLLDTKTIHSPNFLCFFNILLPKHFLQTILNQNSRNSNEQLMGEVSSRSPSLIKLSKISYVVLKNGPKMSKALCLILNAKSSSSRIKTRLNFKVSHHRFLRRCLLLILDYSYKWFQNIH